MAAHGGVVSARVRDGTCMSADAEFVMLLIAGTSSRVRRCCSD
jgi:hypothetical protein